MKKQVQTVVGKCTRTHRKRLRIGYNLEPFSTKSTFSSGINRIYDEIPHAWDEIRLDGGWGDLILSKLVWISS